MLWAPTPESQGLDELHSCLGPPLLTHMPAGLHSRSSSQLDFLLFLGTAGVVLGTEISLFSTSFHPYNTAYEKWTIFSLFSTLTSPLPSPLYFLFKNKSFVFSYF